MTAPAGATVESIVTVSSEETGSLKRVTFPFPQASTTAATLAATRPGSGSAGKRIAAVAVVALLLALAATAYFVLRGPERRDDQAVSSSAPTVQSQAVAPLPAAPGEPSAKQADAQVQAEVKGVAEERRQTEAEKASTEKASAKRRAQKRNRQRRKARHLNKRLQLHRRRFRLLRCLRLPRKTPA